MIGAALAGAAVSLATGWALLAGPGRRPADRLWDLCLAGGAGLCVSSLAFLALRAADATARWALAGLDLALLGLALALRARRRAKGELPPAAPLAGAPGRPASVWLLGALLAAGSLAALVRALCWFRDHPHGWWDAWAIWNLKARFLASPGPEWQRAFSPLIAWSHPDYPLLLPLDVARLWLYAGELDPRLPAGLSLAFAALSVAGLVAAVGRERGPLLGALAGLALLATPVFLELSAYQTADLPLAFFLLMALGSVAPAWGRERGSARPWLALGLAAGAAAWTKNEGLLMGLAVAAGLAAAALRAGRPDARPGWLLAGLAPPLAALVAFELTWAGPRDLWAGQQWSDWASRAGDPERHRLILAYAAATLWSASGGWPLALLALLSALAGLRSDPTRRPELVAIAVALAGIAAGYYAVYLLTPRDLAWHLETSARRLWLQLWPSALLGLFLGLRAPREWWAWRLARSGRA